MKNSYGIFIKNQYTDFVLFLILYFMSDKTTIQQVVDNTETNKSVNVFQTVLLVILVLLSAFQVAFIMNLIPNFNKQAAVTPSTNNSTGLEKVVRDALLEHEYAKVGSKENYDTITALQIALLKYPQYEGNIDAQKKMLAQISGSDATTTTTAAVTTQKLSEEQMSAILSGAIMEGNKDANIVAVEYSDLECPFCIRQNNDNKITDTLHNEYGDKVVTIFKNHRGVDHAGTEVKALSLLCANKVGGEEAYIKFYRAVLEGSTTSSVYPVAKLPDLAKEIGLDVKAWQSCVDNKDMLTQFAKETNEAIGLNLSGTPGTLIFNRKTGAYTTIAGAYPYAQFKSAVDTLLAE